MSQTLEHLIKCLFSFKRKTADKALKRCLKEFEASEKCRLQEIWRKRVYQLTVEELERVAIACMYANQKT
jgi:16S rRNA A1518/A1519 N6-dimethyltransferase RsmA/KsgA/DIM1 with predicted DNA glycosylase/AP lyase activity